MTIEQQAKEREKAYAHNQTLAEYQATRKLRTYQAITGAAVVLLIGMTAWQKIEVQRLENKLTTFAPAAQPSTSQASTLTLSANQQTALRTGAERANTVLFPGTLSLSQVQLAKN